MKQSKKKHFYVQKTVASLLVTSVLLQGCTSSTLKAPCDNFGRNCEPKIKINQWTPNRS